MILNFSDIAEMLASKAFEKHDCLCYATCNDFFLHTQFTIQRKNSKLKILKMEFLPCERLLLFHFASSFRYPRYKKEPVTKNQ